MRAKNTMEFFLPCFSAIVLALWAVCEGRVLVKSPEYGRDAQIIKLKPETAHMSSQHADSNHLSDAGNAIDRKVNGQFFQSGCAMTSEYNKRDLWTLDENPWWTVDFETTSDVKSIQIMNRQDCCYKRLRDFTIMIGSHVCAYHRGTFRNSKVIKCDHTVRGNSITIYLNDTIDSLALCDVKVYGQPVPPRDLTAQASDLDTFGCHIDSQVTYTSDKRNACLAACTGRMFPLNFPTPESCQRTICNTTEDKCISVRKDDCVSKGKMFIPAILSEVDLSELGFVVPNWTESICQNIVDNCRCSDDVEINDADYIRSTSFCSVLFLLQHVTPATLVREMGFNVDFLALMDAIEDIPKWSVNAQTFHPNCSLPPARQHEIVRKGSGGGAGEYFYAMHELRDCKGSDMGIMRRTTLADCTSRCNKEERCKSFQFNSVNQCYLKSSSCTPAQMHHSRSGRMYNKKDFYQMYDSKDCQGSDIEVKSSITLADCIARCSNKDSCKSFQFYKSNVCYLKNITCSPTKMADLKDGLMYNRIAA